MCGPTYDESVSTITRRPNKKVSGIREESPKPPTPKPAPAPVYRPVRSAC